MPRGGGDGIAIWRAIQLLHSKAVVEQPQRLISNWLPIVGLPSPVRLYDFKAGISLGLAQTRMKDAPWPLVPYRRGFLSSRRCTISRTISAPACRCRYRRAPDRRLSRNGMEAAGD